MKNMQTPDERIAELEKEVKALTRLVREMAAREKVTTTRLKMVAQNAAATAKNVKALDTAARKADSKINHVQSLALRKSS